MAYALGVNQQIIEASPVGTLVYLDGHRGDPDFAFPSTQAMLNALATRRDNHISNARAILNA